LDNFVRLPILIAKTINDIYNIRGEKNAKQESFIDDARIATWDSVSRLRRRATTCRCPGD
jgi:hypothetical protein